MPSYVSHRLVSVGVPILLIILATFFTQSDREAWELVLKITALLGVTHFIVGFIFQIRSALNRRYDKKIFFGLFLGSILLVYLSISALYAFNLTVIVGVCAFLYFMIHGTLNEITLFENAFPQQRPPYLFLTATGLAISGLGIASLNHSSSLWTSDYSIPHTVAISLFMSHHEFFYDVFSVLGYSLIGFGALVALLGVIRKEYPVLQLVALSICGAMVGWLVLYGSVHFLYLFSLVLMYHFVLWYLVTRERARFARERSLHHEIHAVVFLAAFLALFFAETYPLSTPFFLDADTFFIWSVVHISTSFLNEKIFLPWLTSRSV